MCDCVCVCVCVSGGEMGLVLVGISWNKINYGIITLLKLCEE